MCSTKAGEEIRPIAPKCFGRKAKGGEETISLVLKIPACFVTVSYTY